MTDTATNWSAYQLAIFEAVETGRTSLRVDAVAGSGKTTTAVEVVRRIAAQSASSGRRLSLAFCAYNKAIANEIGARVGTLPGVRSGTFHGFGFSAWMKVAPKCKVDDKKLLTILRETEVPEQYHEFATKAVSLAKGHAIGVLTPMDSDAAWDYLVGHYDLDETLTDDPTLLNDADMATLVRNGLGYARRLLTESIARDLTAIDFDDMIYAPLVHNAKIWENDWVIVDEAQDTNPARRALARRMLRPGGRLLAVGDPHQAIYGFTGADADALDRIQQEFNCQRLPLTVSYRCPQAVVRHAQKVVSHIEAAPGATEGQVLSMSDENFWANATALTASDAILCRNTKPLVEIAFALIRQRIPCHVEGRDIGRGLVALATKWRIKSLAKLREKLTEYLAKEVARLMAKGQEQKAESLADRVETLLVIAASLPPEATTVELRTAIEGLFGDVTPGQPSPNVTLCTVHKSKGREWRRVFLWGRNRYMPSPFARQDWQAGQERNLEYVAITRAQQTLVEVVVPKPAPKRRGTES